MIPRTLRAFKWIHKYGSLGYKLKVFLLHITIHQALFLFRSEKRNHVIESVQIDGRFFLH